ncbi:MAG: hypothetical protein QME79_00085 [Bacillota bacterium]|nr:hypothetical protein [Bacillota bacterium]
MDAAAAEVYGKTFPELWRDWRAYERERFKDFRMDGERLTYHGWFVQDPKLYAGRLYYKRWYLVPTGKNLYERHEIIERRLSDGAERTLLSTTAGFTMPMRIHRGKLYYAVNEAKPGFANASERTFGLYAVLRQRDLATGADRVIVADEMRSFAILPDGTVLYAKDRKDEFGSELRLYNPATRENRLLRREDYLVEEFVADDQRVVVSARRDWENADLYLFSPATRELEPLVNTPAMEAGLCLEGERLFYTSNFSRTYAVYCYDFRTGKTYRLTRGGFAAWPAYDAPGGQLYFVGLTSAGFDLYRKPAEFEEFRVRAAETPPQGRPAFTLDEREITAGTYLDNLKTLAPSIRMPLWATRNDGVTQLGALFMGMDAIGDFAYAASFLYDTGSRESRYTVGLNTAYWAPVEAGIQAGNENRLGTDKVSLTVDYPCVVRLSPGLSNLTVGVSTSYTGAAKRLETAPYVGMRFSYPLTRAVMETRLPLDGGAAGIYTEAGLSRQCLGGEVSLKVSYGNDPEAGEAVLGRIRGYEEPLPDKVGEIITAEYSRTLFRLDRGWWSPSFFLEDAYASLFVDGAVAGQEVRQASGGAEFHLRATALGCLRC